MQVMATQLFQWAQDHQAPIEQEAADVVDVGDRLAWVLFKQGEIEQSKSKISKGPAPSVPPQWR